MVILNENQFTLFFFLTVHTEYIPVHPYTGYLNIQIMKYVGVCCHKTSRSYLEVFQGMRKPPREQNQFLAKPECAFLKLQMSLLWLREASHASNHLLDVIKTSSHTQEIQVSPPLKKKNWGQKMLSFPIFLLVGGPL